ncbi:glycosyltransferase family 4 protein [Sphingomonas sp.]|uniref:glycosyltransferase family 4 protein n=1 Tax=Sphingomonas sp. TaxID=28214 RepID=UPI0025DB6C8C|nr:glycosyltransferase family 4 protein [Sphingomonas sp.]
MADGHKLAGPRILCVHQGAELYGSDRSFLQTVVALREGWPNANIRVVLAVDGPLRAMLAQVADSVTVRDLCVLRLVNPMTTGLKATIALPWYLLAAIRDIARADFVYINTTVIADYMLAARVAPRRAVIHVREIPKPKARSVIRGLCRVSGAHIIFNSHATQDAFALPPAQPQVVIHNGVDFVTGPDPLELPDAFTVARPLRMAMLGRINDWKGQDLLVEAVATLPPEDRARVRVRIVGSSFRDAAEPVTILSDQIAAAGLGSIVTLEPFKDDPDEVYRWADICVVPSRMPEPFGRVAIEAMAHGRAVIAAAHGGLTEIVHDPISGWLFPPNDAGALGRIIAEAIRQPGAVERRGKGSEARFSEHFSSVTMSRRFRETLARWIVALR